MAASAVALVASYGTRGRHDVKRGMNVQDKGVCVH